MRRPLPYAFARTHQLLLEDDGHTLTLWHSDAPDLSAWSEVLRRHSVQSFEHTDKATPVSYTHLTLPTTSRV